jgi:hypothetical protein
LIGRFRAFAEQWERTPAVVTLDRDHRSVLFSERTKLKLIGMTANAPAPTF